MPMRTRFSKKQIIEDFGFEPVFGYVRVSTEGQSKDDRYGLEMQKKAISDYCMEHRWVVTKWFVDVESGAKIDRPALWDIIRGSNEDHCKRLVVFKSDRISRETKMYFYLLYELERKGLKLECITEEFDAESEFANLYRSMMMFVAEQERKNIAYRTAKGRSIKKSRGGYCGGRIPFGYKSSHVKELELDRVEAWMVQYIFYRYEQGTGLYTIAHELDDRGFKNRNGNKMQQSTIRSIIANMRFYQGYTKDEEGNEIKGKHQNILRDISVENYPKGLKEGETLILYDIFTNFEKDPEIKPSQDITRIKIKNHDKYLRYRKEQHILNGEETMEIARSNRKPYVKPEKPKKPVVEESVLERQIREYMENATISEGEE